jgi:hypothetical protein
MSVHEVCAQFHCCCWVRAAKSFPHEDSTDGAGEGVDAQGSSPPDWILEADRRVLAIRPRASWTGRAAHPRAARHHGRHQVILREQRELVARLQAMR